MKLQRSLLFLMLLAFLPVLSGCEYLGIGNAQQQRQEAYEEQLKAYQEYQKQQKAYQEQQEAYQQQVMEAYQQQIEAVYKEYERGLNTWYEQRQELITEAIVTDNTVSTDNTD
ncbi:hypothetical protein ACFLW9_04255 [Chloroflexota bacterium]